MKHKLIAMPPVPVIIRRPTNARTIQGLNTAVSKKPFSLIVAISISGGVKKLLTQPIMFNRPSSPIIIPKIGIKSRAGDIEEDLLFERTRLVDCVLPTT
jgi:hypothetical protein